MEGEITPATLHLPILDVCASYKLDSCADSRTVAFLSDELNLYPVVSVPDSILQQVRTLVAIGNENIQVSIVVVIADSGATTNFLE